MEIEKEVEDEKETTSEANAMPVKVSATTQLPGWQIGSSWNQVQRSSEM